MLGRRLLALVVAVLCIVARLGMETGGTSADEIRAFGGPALLGRTQSAGEVSLEGPEPPDGVPEPSRPPSLVACVAPCGACSAFHASSPARPRGGDPKVSRGPPSRVVS